MLSKWLSAHLWTWITTAMALPALATSLLPGHGVAQRRTCELLGPHGLCEQKALRQSEAHLAHGKKVGRGLHALGDSTYAVAIRKVENATGYRLLQWFISAASDEFAIKSEIFPAHSLCRAVVRAGPSSPALRRHSIYEGAQP